MNTSLLLLGLLFSSAGLGYFLYGRKQRMLVPLLCGLALMAVPYLVASAVWLLVIGVALMAIPYFIRL